MQKRFCFYKFKIKQKKICRFTITLLFLTCLQIILSETPKETPTQVFFYEYCKILKNTYFQEHLQTAASDNMHHDQKLNKWIEEYTLFFISNAFFNWASALLTFFMNRASILLSLIHHLTITVLTNILYLVYLSKCLDLGLFVSYLCNLFFIFSLIVISINNISPLKQTYLLFVYFLEYLLLFLDDNMDEESKHFSNSKSSPAGCCLTFAWAFANFSLALLIKLMLIKKGVYSTFIITYSVNNISNATVKSILSVGKVLFIRDKVWTMTNFLLLCDCLQIRSQQYT